VPAQELADCLARVRQHKHTRPLPTISPLAHVEQLRAEADNIAQCLKFASENLA
jgi:hypothetical protein